MTKIFEWQRSGLFSLMFAQRPEAERFDQLLKVANVRIERIVSTGQARRLANGSTAWDEWVVVITGAAEILLEDEMPAHRFGRATTSSFRRTSATGHMDVAQTADRLARCSYRPCAGTG